MLSLSLTYAVLSHTRSFHTHLSLSLTGPDIVSHNIAISACAGAGWWERALAILDDVTGGGGIGAHLGNRRIGKR